MFCVLPWAVARSPLRSRHTSVHVSGGGGGVWDLAPPDQEEAIDLSVSSRVYFCRYFVFCFSVRTR